MDFVAKPRAYKRCACGGTPRTGGLLPSSPSYMDALRIYLWMHTQKYPESWFSALELWRVAEDQYIHDMPGASARTRTSRPNLASVTKRLMELEAMGDVERRDCGCHWRGVRKHARPD